MTPWQIMQTIRYHGAARDSLYDSVILLWNMKDAVTTAPPLDQSKYAKTYVTYGVAPLYQTDQSGGPFAGGNCSRQIYDGNGTTNYPKRCSSTDTAWDFSSISQTLTIEGWVYVASVAGNARVNTLRAIASAGSGNWIWPGFQYTGGIVRAQLDIIGTTPINTAAGVSPATWFHYVMQWTGTTVWMGVAGTRLGSTYVAGNVTYNDLMLQMMNTSLGTLTDSGILCGPHRVTLGPNRYNLDSSSSYTVPTDYFPVSA